MEHVPVKWSTSVKWSMWLSKGTTNAVFWPRCSIRWAGAAFDRGAPHQWSSSHMSVSAQHWSQ
jgi:hypothetical protein